MPPLGENQISSEEYSDTMKMTIDVQSSLSMLSMSDPVPVTAVPTRDPDHNDVSDYWWDNYVTQFPSEYYSLLSPLDYNDLFGDEDEEAEEMIYNDEEAKEMIPKTRRPRI